MITLLWLLFSLLLMVVGVGLLGLGIYYWILALPYVLLVWFSWSTIISFGFLGYIGILALIILPIAFLCDKALDSREYLGTGISATILIGIAALYSLIAYWNVVKWVLITTFFLGCAFVLIDTYMEEKENA